MFTGIVTSSGEITEAKKDGGDMRICIASDYRPESIAIGASIACDGVCLTVTGRGAREGGSWFTADISAETLSCTTLGSKAEGGRLNLERSLKVGDELGGHIVTGHVDEIGKIIALKEDGDSLRVTVRTSPQIARFIAEKGSVTVNGVSLTVNEVTADSFGVNLIPHTSKVTTLGQLSADDEVNIEIDVLARYVERLKQSG